MIWQVLAFVGMFWLLSFVAAMLLCSPALFNQLPRRHRARKSTQSEARSAPQGEPKHLHSSNWRYFLIPVVAPIMLALLVLVLIPAFVAMWLGVVCVNFRYCRRAAYRALRRRGAVLASCRSYPSAFAVFFR